MFSPHGTFSPIQLLVPLLVLAAAIYYGAIYRNRR
jgi:hypothetical protein